MERQVEEQEDEGQVLLFYTTEEALNAVGFGRYQGAILFYAGCGWFAEAMEVMILSFIGPSLKSQWSLSSAQESLLSTVVFAGMLVGAYTWGLVSDHFGRKRGFLCITTITSAAGLLSTFSPNYASLLVLRWFVGLGLGGGHVFLSWFLEFVPASHRGTWMVVFSTFWSIGTIFEALLAWIVMPRLNWRWLLGFSAIPSIVLLLCYGYTSESPRYLCLRGRATDAYHVLEKMALINGHELPPGMLLSYGTNSVDGEINSSQREPLLSATGRKIAEFKSGFSSFAVLFSSKLLQTTILLWVLFFGNTFAYYGIVLMTSALSEGQIECGSTTLRSENLRDDSLYTGVLVTSFAELPGLLLSAIIVDKVGRKLSMAIMFTCFCIFLLPLLSQQSSVVTIGLLFGARMFSMGTFTVACIYAPELYPTAVRATGNGAANAVGRIGGMICPLVAVGLVTSCNLKPAIILFEVVAGITIVNILLFPFETKGRELSDTVDTTNSKQAALEC